MFNSQVLPLSGRKLGLYLSRETSSCSLLKNFSINLNFCLKYLRYLFNSPRVLSGVWGKFCDLLLGNQLDFVKFMSERLTILGFMLLILFVILPWVVVLFGLCGLKMVSYYVVINYCVLRKRSFLSFYLLGSLWGSSLLWDVLWWMLTHPGFVGICGGWANFVCILYFVWG